MPNYRMRSAYGEVAVPKEQVDPLRKQGWVLLGPVPDFQTSRQVLDAVQTPDFSAGNLLDEQGHSVVLPEPTRMRAATPEERVVGRYEEEGNPFDADVVLGQFALRPNQPETARTSMRAATLSERVNDRLADITNRLMPAWKQHQYRVGNTVPEPFHYTYDPTMGSATPGKEFLKRGLYSRIDDLLVSNTIGKKGVSPARLAKLTTADRALIEEANWRNIPALIEEAGGAKTTQRTIPTERLRGFLDDNPAPLPVVKTLGGMPKRLSEYLGSPGAPDMPRDVDEWMTLSDRLSDWSNQARQRGDRPLAQRLSDLAEDADDMSGGGGGLAGGPPQYSQYQIPGGQNYRETLLQMPQKPEGPLPKGYAVVRLNDPDRPGARFGLQHPHNFGPITLNASTAEQAEREARGYLRSRNMLPPAVNFPGRHFAGETNVIAHSRSNERLGPTGWISHNEEFQSDPHQKARDLVNETLDNIRSRTRGLTSGSSRADTLRHALPAERTIIESGGYQGNISPEQKARLAHIAEALSQSDAEVERLNRAVEAAGYARLDAVKKATIENLAPEWRGRIWSPGDAARFAESSGERGANVAWRNAREAAYAKPSSNLTAAILADRQANEALSEAIRRHNDLRTERHGLMPEGLAPNIPFKETWPDLAAKQWILEEAANPRSTGLSFTSGQTQAERYGAALAQAADRLEWQDLGNGKGYLTAFKGHDAVLNEITTTRGLAQYIGKDAAQQLLSAEVNRGIRRADVRNLRVGGAGMRSFYDENRPPAISKILAPFGIQPFRPSTVIDPTRVNAKTNLPHVEPSWFTGWTEEQKQAILKKGLPMSVLLGMLLGRPPQPETQEKQQ